MGDKVLSVDSIRDASVRRKLARLCAEYREQSEQIAAAEAAKKSLMKQIEPIARSLRAEKVTGESWSLLKITSTRKTIKAEKLVALGVDMDVIDEATDISVSEYFQIKGRKEGAEE